MRPIACGHARRMQSTYYSSLVRREKVLQQPVTAERSVCIPMTCRYSVWDLLALLPSIFRWALLTIKPSTTNYPGQLPRTFFLGMTAPSPLAPRLPTKVLQLLPPRSTRVSGSEATGKGYTETLSSSRWRCGRWRAYRTLQVCTASTNVASPPNGRQKLRLCT